MIDMTDVVADLTLQAPQSVTILRSTGSWVAGGFQSSTAQFQVNGVVQPATDKEIGMLPEGDRVGQVMAFWLTVPVLLTHGGQSPGTSDILQYYGEKYRVLSVKHYGGAGYWKALGTRLSAA